MASLLISTVAVVEGIFSASLISGPIGNPSRVVKHQFPRNSVLFDWTYRRGNAETEYPAAGTNLTNTLRGAMISALVLAPLAPIGLQPEQLELLELQ